LGKKRIVLFGLSDDLQTVALCAIDVVAGAGQMVGLDPQGFQMGLAFQGLRIATVLSIPHPIQDIGAQTKPLANGMPHHIRRPQRLRQEIYPTENAATDAKWLGNFCL
jgi:hypothetical protein